MPQFFNAAVMTNAGAALLARSIAEGVTIDFLSVAVGNGSYTNAEKAVEALKQRTALKSFQVGYTPQSVIREDNSSVRISALLSNFDPDTHEAVVESGFYINEIGIMAQPSDEATDPILFSIAVTSATQGDYMPAYTGDNPAQIVQGYVTAVSNDATISIIDPVNPYALATDLQELADTLDARMTQFEEDVTADIDERIESKLTKGNKTTVTEPFRTRVIPVASNGVGNIRKIYGNSEVHNQLVKNGNFVGTTDWSKTFSTLSVSDNVATITPSANYGKVYQRYDTIEGHKYLFRVDTKKESGSFLVGLGHSANLMSEGVYAQLTADNAWHTTAIIGTWHAAASPLGSTETVVMTTSDDFSPIYVRRVKVVDLTQQYGSGNEPSTVDEYIARGGNLDVEDYDAGTLIDCKPEAIKVTGKNLLNTNDYSVLYTVIDQIGNGYVSAHKTISGEASVQFSANPNVVGKTISFSCDVPNSTEVNNRVQVIYSSGGSTVYRDGTRINNHSTLMTAIPSDATNIRLRLCISDAVASGTTVDFTNIQLEIGSTTTSYEPYHESILPLPITEVADGIFSDGMKSAGSVRDELTRDKAVKRIGVVDLGTLTYNKGDIGFMSYQVLSQSGASFISTLYSYNSRIWADPHDGDAAFTSEGRILLVNNNYTDATAFKTAMSGVMLYYELATPVTSPINPPLLLTYEAEPNGTETLIVPDGEESSPMVADTDYVARDEAINLSVGNALVLQQMTAKVAGSMPADYDASGTLYPPMSLCYHDGQLKQNTTDTTVSGAWVEAYWEDVRIDLGAVMPIRIVGSY